MDQKFNEEQAEELDGLIKALFNKYSPTFGAPIVSALMLRVSVAVMWASMENQDDLIKFINESLAEGIAMGNQMKEQSK